MSAQMPIRIGVMLRAVSEKGGVGVYTRNITAELLALDQRNEYVLFYDSAADLGRFGDHPRMTERVVAARSKLLWDQVAIPRACRREGVDVLFHPKFSVPVVSPCKTAMVLHGAGWFVPDAARFWSRGQRLYARLAMPLYLRRADAVLAVSEVTTRLFTSIFRLPEGTVETVHLAPARNFRRIEEAATLQAAKAKYRLPDRFILTLSGRDRGPRKNIDVIFEAFRRVRREAPCALVVVGRDCDKLRDDFDIPDAGFWDDVVFPGWVEQIDLPAIFSQAEVFLYPSRWEAFPIPVSEAFACGTPVITSNVYGLAEVAGDAAIQVDPRDAAAVASALERVLGDGELRTALAAKGRARAELFTWDRCAGKTLAILERLANATS